MPSKNILLLAMLAVISGCGGVEPSSNTETAHGTEQADGTPQSFTVRLDPATTADTVIPQIVAAAHTQIAPMCEAHPDALLRIYNPLKSGAYADVSCSAVLVGEGATGEASAELVTDESDGPLGTVQQKWSPFGLGCGIAVVLVGAFANHVLCAHPKAARPEACKLVTETGFIGLGIACAFM